MRALGIVVLFVFCASRYYAFIANVNSFKAGLLSHTLPLQHAKSSFSYRIPTIQTKQLDVLRMFRPPVLRAKEDKINMERLIKRAKEESVGEDDHTLYDEYDDDDQDSADVEMRIVTDMFDRLKSKDETVSYESFMNQEDIKDLLAEKVTTERQIQQIWKDIAQGKLTPLNYANFAELTLQFDELLSKQLEGYEGGSFYDEEYDEANADEEESPKGAQKSKLTGGEEDEQEEGEKDDDVEGGEDDMADVSDIDPYDPTLKVADVYDKDTLSMLSKEFKQLGEDGMLSFPQLMGWEKLRQMAREEGLGPDDLKSLWDEAPKKGNRMNLDTFIRFNLRLDSVLQAAEDAANDQGQVTEFYREFFRDLTRNETLLSWDRLLEWKELQNLMSEGQLTKADIKDMWDELPKSDIPGTKLKGITFDTFMELNEQLQATYEPAYDEAELEASEGKEEEDEEGVEEEEGAEEEAEDEDEDE